MNSRDLLITVTLSLLSIFSFAQKQVAYTDNKPDFTVVYLGDEIDMLLIGVFYENISGETFHLSVLTDKGEVVYRNIYNSKNLEKKFRIPKEHAKLNFVISSSSHQAVKSVVLANTSLTDQGIATGRAL